MNRKHSKGAALLLIPIAVVIGFIAFIIADDSTVHFADENLETAVREALDQPEGPVRQEDLQEVDSIDLSYSGIESLEGIEKLITVRDLNLEGNRIEDIDPLEELIYLEDLNLRGNHVEDVAVLEKMERMRSLDLRETGIKDVEAIAHMTTLQDLNVRGNSITSIEPLENMVELRKLNVRNNHIEDISVLSHLNKLEDINLRHNAIQDFSPVFELPHLTERLYVEGNPGVNMKDFIPLFEQVDNMDIDKPELALVFNQEGGFYSSPQTVELEQLMEEEPGTIRYTTDGSEPNEESESYTDPIEVDETTVVKAKFFDQYGNAGEMVSNTYIIGEESTFPVVSIAGNPDDFFGEANGIYTEGVNYDEDAENPEETANYAQSGDQWEREVSVEMYKPDGTNMIHQQAGVRLHGNTSRYYPKKSFRLYGRSDYDSENTFSYPIFESEDDSEYNRLLLRNSGNDWDDTVFRDAFLQELITGFDVEKQAFRPSNLYLNGEYWGIYNLRERIDKHYFEYKLGVLEEDLEYLENNANVREGDNRHYQKMLSYMEHNDITDPQVYAQVKEQMDINNFIDYNIAEIYVRNTDWPANNNRYWREKPNGKWRWTVFDLDFGFDLAGVSETAAHHTLHFATEEGNDSWPNPDWATFLLRTLLKNEEFRAQFAGKFAHYLNTHFDDKIVTEKLSEFEAMYEPEMEKNIDRWDEPESMEKWHENVEVMRQFGQVRDDYMYAHLMDYLQLDGYADLTFNIDGEHNVEIYGEEVPLENGQWEGTYLTGVPLEIRVDKKPAKLSSSDSDAAAVDEDGRLVISADGYAEIELASNDGEAIGTIQVAGSSVQKENITIESGETINWSEETNVEGAYASISNPDLGETDGEQFTAEGAGEGLLTIHNDNNEVTAMARVKVIDPADEARVYNEDHPAAQYEGSWQESTNEEHHEGTAAFSDIAGDKIEITFKGTGIRWFGYEGVTQGIAEIEVDGEKMEVDTYAEEAIFNKELYSVEGLEDGTHTLTITVSGNLHEDAVNHRVHIDSFEVIQ
ncbi:CotH kinase family protein [Alteribacillus sp. YIM 98480]|uniref:CotH kinase family protein n=1 Tax=Alteribacillus sp. YIM 98480 TaxID=2606599 RepID=UPI00131D2D51|nr:CotH kinase family protein [Alteribacillus sp. YIM 98480]